MEKKIFMRMLTLKASEDSKKKALFYKINHGIKFDTFLKLSAQMNKFEWESRKSLASAKM